MNGWRLQIRRESLKRDRKGRLREGGHGFLPWVISTVQPNMVLSIHKSHKAAVNHLPAAWARLQRKVQHRITDTLAYGGGN